jgi:hypothetical protein
MSEFEKDELKKKWQSGQHGRDRYLVLLELEDAAIAAIQSVFR